MGFGKAIQHSDALAEFALASMVYKKECSRIAKLRIALDRLDAQDFELAQYSREKRKFKDACKIYNAARAKYISIVRPTYVRPPSITDSELFALALETNDRAIAEQIRQDAVARSVSQEEIEAVRKAMTEREAVKNSSKDSFLTAREDDPTFADFSPL